VVLCASFKTTKVQAQAVNIGDVSELNGSAQIVRDKPYDANLEFAIQSNDEAVTSNGRMAITFLDDSTVRLTEHSRLSLLMSTSTTLTQANQRWHLLSV
jgi:hypothetical protein